MNLVLFSVFSILSLNIVTGFPKFADKFPNGHNVPHPCKKNSIWKGVGHRNMGGGGERNPFGRDFAAADYVWTTELCKKDSDQDGRTNGEELGDPKCQWTPNAIPQRSINITHPGICEPVDSPHCRSLQDYQCAGEYNCSAVNAPDVKYLDLRLDYTTVPTDLTTYICQVFKVPTDKKYHAIAFEPLINNSKVLHHIVVNGCNKPPKDHTLTPHRCGMSQQNCQQTVAVWTVGLEGICLHSDTGLPFGNNSYEYFAINVHWTNPDGRTDWKDSSGIRVFYTDKLRKYDEGTFATGQMEIELPPQKKKVTLEGYCQSKCLQPPKMPHRLNITSVLMHMHYLGISGKLEQYRNGKLLRVVADDKYYYYENPVVFKFDPPLDWLPGDEFKTICDFQTMTRNGTSYFGEGTFDEMCFALITYYPKKKDLQGCVQFAKYDSCGEGRYGECKMMSYYNKTVDLLAKDNTDFWDQCDTKNGKTCNLKCQSAMKELYDDKCMKGSVGTFTRNLLIHGVQTVSNGQSDLSNAVRACDTELQKSVINKGAPAAKTIGVGTLILAGFLAMLI